VVAFLLVKGGQLDIPVCTRSRPRNRKPEYDDEDENDDDSRNESKILVGPAEQAEYCSS
jgi:hypothetical protein